MKLFPATPPPGPAREDFWRSPIRGAWLTSFIGSFLFPFLILVGLTGFFSHAAYNPDLGANAIFPRENDIQFLLFDWPTKPSWLYAFNQGLHTIVGIALVPIVLLKLWSVIPKLFSWPPVKSPGHALERLSTLGLVGGIIFLLVTGVLNVQLYYPFRFNFVVAHYYAAIVFLVSLFLHVATKLPTMRKAYRERGVLKPLMNDLAHTEPEPYEPGELAPLDPAEPTISRRGVLALAGTASAALIVTNAGQSLGGPFRRTAIFGARGGSYGGDFPVNKTAALARVTPEMGGDAYRLQLAFGDRTLALSRTQLLAMELETHDLPIACVEGWQTTQTWQGIPLRRLAEMVGAGDGSVRVESLQARGAFRQTTLSRDQVNAGSSMLALKVNGKDLSLDHGFPARIIVPALPGVHNTKWVEKLVFA